MSDKMKEKFSELNMTRDELERLTEAMKKEEFRKLLVEYAEEISDPKNRELYEREIAQLEQERGMNVVFIHPEAGYCLKTTKNGTEKCFINICKNVNVEKPTSSVESRRTTNNGATRPGLFWHIPHTCSPPREDIDNNKSPCTVYDVVFHPDAYRMGETNERFNALLRDTAMDSIERNFNVKLDRVNYKKLKNLNFKGRPTSTVIRKPSSNSPLNKNGDMTTQNTNENNAKISEDQVDNLVDQLKKQYFDDQLRNSSRTPSAQKEKPSTSITTSSNKSEDLTSKPEYTIPKYTLVHRGQIDVQDYANELENPNGIRLVNSTRPKELVIKIDLPLCKSSDLLSLDIFEKQLVLKSNDPNYLLDLKLPFPINEKESKAKFDKSKRCLNVTLPVIPFVEKINVVNIEKLDDQLGEVDEQSKHDDSSSASVTSSTSSLSLNSFSNDITKSSISNDFDEKEANVQPNQSDSNTNSDLIKYTLPVKFEINEYKRVLNLKINVPNYDQNSVQIKFETTNSISIKCESTSSGGYTKYYSAFINFFDQMSPFECISSNILSRVITSTVEDDLGKQVQLEFISQDSFEIVFEKCESTERLTNSKRKALISVEKIDNRCANDTKLLEIEISVDLNNNESFKTKNEDKNSTNLNKLTKKEFIYEFQKTLDKLSSDEDDDDSDCDVEDDKKSQKNIISTVKSQQRKLNHPSFDIDLPAKIDEEADADINEEEDDLEKKYLVASEMEKSEDDNNLNRIDNSLSSSSNNENSLSSSLNGSTFSRLKGILKKPRSFSESEMSFSNINSDLINREKFGGSESSNASDEANDLNGSKKCVSFNNQVVRNVFKPGSTVIGMKKPNANKNKKKNKRKRTISDPSHDNNESAINLKDSASSFTFRARSISESSDDSSAILTNSNDSLHESDSKASNPTPNTTKNAKKKTKKKKARESNKNNSASATDQVAKTKFDMETMLNWKNQGRLAENDKANQLAEKTKNVLTFTNKIMNDLDV